VTYHALLQNILLYWPSDRSEFSLEEAKHGGVSAAKLKWDSNEFDSGNKLQGFHAGFQVLGPPAATVIIDRFLVAH
jgi:hypothetical protein